MSLKNLNTVVWAPNILKLRGCLMFKVTNVRSVLFNPKVVFLVLCLIAYSVEHEMTVLMKHQSVADSVFNLRTVYQKLITAGPRELRQNYTALVVINPGKDNEYKQETLDSGSPCREKGTRNTLAKLLNKIAEQNPAEIVIDKFFKVACGDDDPGTIQLKDTLQKISLQTPIIIGRLIPYGTEDAELIEHSGTPPVLEASEHPLTFLDKGNIHQGIVNIDPDNRRLALKWLVKPDEKSESEETDTLAFAAVKAYYQSQSGSWTKEHPEIIKLSELDKNPYISLIEPSKFELKIPAGKLLMADSSESFPKLRGKIVIIGEADNQYDKHDSVFNSKIDGFILQANYIEAMLDQRYYKPIPWLDYIIGFLVFVAVYYCGLNIRPVWKLIVYLSLFLFGVFLLLYLPVVLFGFYINPITISSLAIVIIVTHQFFPKHQSQSKEEQEPIK